jgi:hypothetical protein
MKWIKSYKEMILESNEMRDLDKELFKQLMLPYTNPGRSDDRIRELLKAGADPNVKFHLFDDMRPLHLIAMSNYPVLIDSFLEAGAEIEARDKRGRTPLHVAVYNLRQPTVEKLLDAGADPVAKNGEGQTPLNMLKSSFENVLDTLVRPMIKTLIKHGVSPSQAFETMEEFKDYFFDDISWYEGDMQDLERKFMAVSTRKKLF